MNSIDIQQEKTLNQSMTDKKIDVKKVIELKKQYNNFG